MSEFEERLRQLEDLSRSATGPPEATADRVWSAIEHRLVEGPPGPELDSGSASPELLGADSVAKVSALKVVAGLAVVGAIVGAVALVGVGEPASTGPEQAVALEVGAEAKPVMAKPSPSPAPTPALALAPAALAPAALAPAVLAPASVASLEPAKAEPSSPVAKSARPKAPTKPAAPKTLADELTLMRQLSAALKEGDSTRALELVAEHERDFAKGDFVEERRASKARALCARGKLDTGRREAERFEARWPSSIHLPAVRDGCGL